MGNVGAILAANDCTEVHIDHMEYPILRSINWWFSCVVEEPIHTDTVTTGSRRVLIHTFTYQCSI